MSDFSSPEYPVASKSYKCVWCVDRISPGVKHLHFKGVWQGDFQDWRMHVECEKAHDMSRHDFYHDGEICMDGHLRGFSCREMEIRRTIREMETAGDLVVCDEEV